MAHNIKGKMVYSFEKPMWHNITEPSLVPMTAEEILDSPNFGGGYEMMTRPVTVELNGEQVETGDFAVVRGTSQDDPVERVFGYCTERYHPLQPRDVAHSFDVNVNQPAETMAFLGKGERMFISWKMPSFEVVKGDQIDMYGIVSTGFDTLKGAKLFTAEVRPICWNTLVLAEGWARKNSDGRLKGEIWTGKGVNKNLLRDLGYWMSHVQTTAIREANLTESFFRKLASTPIADDNEATGILLMAYPDANNVAEFYPKELRDDKALSTFEFNEKQEALRQGIFQLFSGAGTAITPDYWGLLNSTTEYFCHVQPSKRPIAESVMFGGRQKATMQMVNVLKKLTD